MKKSLILFLLVHISVFVHTQTNFVWAKGMGGSGLEAAQSTALDALGNVFTIGFFNATADFDPNSGIANLTPKGSYDVFISKLDPDGNFVWANNMGGLGDDFGQAIAIDPAGKIVNTGFFSGTSDFDPGTTQYNLVSAGGNDVYISKLNGVGNFVWAKSIGGIGNDASNSIATDESGNILTTGYFESTADFDPGVASYTLVSQGLQDIFISKLDGSGNFVWAKTIGGAGLDAGVSIATDASGNVIATGYFRGTVDFDPGPGTFTLASQGQEDIFILKLNSTGNFVWAKAMGGARADGGNSVALDLTGKIYTFGYCDTLIDFDPGPGVFTVSVEDGIFISKLDGAGNFVWAKTIDGVDGGQSIALDAFGNVYTTGYYDGAVDFDPSTSVFTITASGGYDVFITKLDTSGNFILARSMGGPQGDGGNAIVADGAGNIFVSGNFDATGDYDPGSGVFNLTAAGFDDIFVMKLGLDVGIKEILDSKNALATIYPNPGNGFFKIAFNEEESLPNSIMVLDMLGRIVLSDDKIDNYHYNLVLANSSGGMFMVKLIYRDRVVMKRVIKN